MHAYSLAVDVNPEENPYVGCGQSRDPSLRPYRNRSRHLKGMVTPRAVAGFRAAGWGWGGADTNGVRVHAPSGDLLAFLHTPEVISNLVFGGTKRNQLFMTGSTSIYAMYVNAVGHALT